MLEEMIPQAAAPSISERPAVLEMGNYPGGAVQNLPRDGELTACKADKVF